MMKHACNQGTSEAKAGESIIQLGPIARFGLKKKKSFGFFFSNLPNKFIASYLFLTLFLAFCLYQFKHLKIVPLLQYLIIPKFKVLGSFLQYFSMDLPVMPCFHMCQSFLRGTLSVFSLSPHLSLPYPHTCMCIYACVCLCLWVCSLKSGWRYILPEMIGSWHLLQLNDLDLNMAVYSSALVGSLNLVHIIT